jgi:hypothetical protein
MQKLTRELIDILHSITAEYRKLESIETEKTDIIIERDGLLLEKLTYKEEEHLQMIDALEERRTEITKKIASLSGIHPDSLSVTALSNIVDTETAEKLKGAASDLSDSMKRVRTLSDTNRSCLNDNIAFFNAILDSIRESVSLSEGYTDNPASKRQLSSSALFNRTV